jgi:hypothetical protein
MTTILKSQINTLSVQQLEIITGEKTNPSIPLNRQKTRLMNIGIQNGTIKEKHVFDTALKLSLTYLIF